MLFREVIGNQHAVNQIRHLIDSDRLPHALLLHGPVGVPKLALARAAAQYLHCQHRTDGDSCGVCPMCKQHQSCNQVDTHYTFPFTNKKGSSEQPCDCNDYMSEWHDFLDQHPVEDYQAWLSLLKADNAQPQILVKESTSIIRQMTLSALTAKYKVLILWLPEKLKEETANKLLKLIEEPFDDCKFILVSDDIKGVLGTIVSRCQRIELRKPSTDEVAHYLQARYGIDEREALAIASPADGNVVLAESMLATSSEVHEFHERFVELMRLAWQRNLPKLRLWSERIADMKREKARRFLAYAVRQVRENFIYNLHTPALNYLTREEETFSTRFAPFINEDNVEQLMHALECASRDIGGNANGKLVMLDLSVQVCHLIKR